MILVDKQIMERIGRNELIVESFHHENVNCISYDLTIDSFIRDESRSYCELAPGEFVMIKTRERLHIPDDLCGIIGEKNSRIRQGLVVMGPRYFPGHTTNAFLRIQNISSNVITLKSGDEIAQIFFEELSQKPDNPYNKQEDASFNDEMDYLGYGRYELSYKEQEKSFETVKDSILQKEQQIYANVLTFMGIIVSVFSIISINYQAFTQATIDFKYIIVMNLTLALCICVLMGLILFIIQNAKRKIFAKSYIIVLALLAVGTIAYGFYAMH